MVGSLDGAIYFFDSIDNNLNTGSNFSLRSNNLLNLAVNLGSYSSCSISDLDNDGNFDLFIGQDLGGVFHLENDANSSVGLIEKPFKPYKLSLFPNPSEGIINFESDEELNHANLYIHSIIGELVYCQKMNSSSGIIDISSLRKGIYLISIPEKGFSTKIILK
jgi:hypothetical protein